MSAPHLPVLLAEVIEGLLPTPNGTYIDGTVGAGGHAQAILEASGPDGRLLGLDADPEALALAAVTLGAYGDRVRLVRSNFTQLFAQASAEGFIPARGVLLDLGLSSMQIANPGRGFSFASESLDMRIDPNTETTASNLVNGLNEDELADLIYKYGEERSSRKIARLIAKARPITSAAELAQMIERVLGRHGRLHPATRTFQALRMAVNHELENLETVLPQLGAVIGPGGRAAVITFQSLEDRIVKRFFKSSPDWRPVNKHTIKAGRDEVVMNPRSRSSQLRVAERV